MKISKVSTFLTVFIFLLSTFFLTSDGVFAETSGYYDFDAFGLSSAAKPIGGNGPLSSNAAILTSWQYYNSPTQTEWWVPHDVSRTAATNAYSATVDIGFNFNYYQERFRYLKVAVNGYVDFNTVMQEFGSVMRPNVRLVHQPGSPHAIYHSWTNDAYVNSNNDVSFNPGAGILYGREGSDFGLRNLIIEYYHVKKQQTGQPDSLTGWVRLYETSNIVELWYFKNMGVTCSGNPPLNINMDVGMESRIGSSKIGDEPPTDPLPNPINTESWHYGCATHAGPAIPATHYRFVPRTYRWNNSTYWPMNFNSVTGNVPDFWSLSNGGAQENTWKWYPTGTGSINSACMAVDSTSSEEILTTRFIDFNNHTGYPQITFTQDFVSDGNNKIEVLLTWAYLAPNAGVYQLPWQTLWSHSGSNINGPITIDFSMPPTFGKEHVQIGFKYSRTDDPVTIASWNMDTDPLSSGWVRGGTISDDWEWRQPFVNDNLRWGRGIGPKKGYNGGAFFGLRPGNTSDNYGDYRAGSNTWVRTGVINCSGYSYVELNYKRWLGVEHKGTTAAGDYGFIEISNNGSTWTQVWRSDQDFSNVFNDVEWMDHTLDISPWAANQPTVYIRWRLQSDSDSQNFRFCGWNLDDVVVRGRANVTGYWAIDNVQFSEGATPTPTPTYTPTPSNTPTRTPTNTPTRTPTQTPTPSSTPTSTPTPTDTPTVTPTWTSSPVPVPTQPGDPTSTPTPPIKLDCDNAIELQCGQYQSFDPYSEGKNKVNSYVCLPSGMPLLNGKEMVFKVYAWETGPIRIHLNTPDPSNFDLIVMRFGIDICSEYANCDWAISNEVLEFWGVQGSYYYIVVDMEEFNETPFTIFAECEGIPAIPATNRIGLVFLVVVLGAVLLLSSRRLAAR